jgi:4,5-dihydroxyphthalate decarboxylase
MSLILSLAIDRYDRHFPFFDGTVKPPPGIELKVLQVGQTVVLRDGEFRHERMIHDQEFDVCEFSLSSYLMARDRGLDITAVPVFPRRLFSAGLFYVRADSAIHSPADLVGRRIGVNSFQTTLSVLARGDLKAEYGVPWEEITWCIGNAEKVAFEIKPGVKLVNLGAGADLGRALADGTIDAFIHPHPPHSIRDGTVRVRGLFANACEEERRYKQRNGYFPIMHVIALRRSLVASHPEIPSIVMDLFAQAKAIGESYYDDPNWSLMVGCHRAFEKDRAHFGADPWPSGLRANAPNLERFIDYMLDQRLLSRRLALTDLFALPTNRM